MDPYAPPRPIAQPGVPAPTPAIAYVRDTRNKQVYKVKRMIDNKCWMIDNLKYIDNSITNVDGTTGTVFRNGSGPNGPASDPVGSGTSWNTVSGSDTQNTDNSDKAFFNNPMFTANCYSTTALGAYMATNTTTHCGYLYNWYAATGGTGLYSIATNGTQATGNICPANFRLPSRVSLATDPTQNGTSTAAADFTVLNASMAAESPATGATTNNSTTYPNWQPNGAWSGTLSGYRNNGITGPGTAGMFWSSTVSSATNSYDLHFDSTNIMSFNTTLLKYYGQAIRCLLSLP